MFKYSNYWKAFQLLVMMMNLRIENKTKIISNHTYLKLSFLLRKLYLLCFFT